MNTTEENTETIEVKLTTDELFDLGRAAEREGFGNLSAFIANTLREKANALLLSTSAAAAGL